MVTGQKTQFSVSKLQTRPSVLYCGPALQHQKKKKKTHGSMASYDNCFKLYIHGHHVGVRNKEKLCNTLE